MNGLQDPMAVLERAECLVDAGAVEVALDQMAVRMTVNLADSDPLIVAVLKGGMYVAAALMKRLRFPLQVDYLHVTRYRNRLAGADLHWLVEPRDPLAGRTVVLVDDVLDEGITLDAVRRWANARGAARVVIAVLVDKQMSSVKPVIADYVAVQAPDRYLFGCGMDYRGYWRNLPEIYAAADVDA